MDFIKFCQVSVFYWNLKLNENTKHTELTLPSLTDSWGRWLGPLPRGQRPSQHVRGAHGRVISTGGLTPAVRRRRRRRYKAPPDARFVSIEREEDEEPYGGGGIG